MVKNENVLMNPCSEPLWGGGGLYFRSEKFHCKFGADQIEVLVMNFWRKNCNIFSRKRGGGPMETTWRFSENSSIWECRGLPYIHVTHTIHYAQYKSLYIYLIQCLPTFLVSFKTERFPKSSYVNLIFLTYCPYLIVWDQFALKAKPASELKFVTVIQRV